MVLGAHCAAFTGNKRRRRKRVMASAIACVRPGASHSDYHILYTTIPVKKKKAPVDNPRRHVTFWSEFKPAHNLCSLIQLHRLATRDRQNKAGATLPCAMERQRHRTLHIEGAVACWKCARPIRTECALTKPFRCGQKPNLLGVPPYCLRYFVGGEPATIRHRASLEKEPVADQHFIKAHS